MLEIGSLVDGKYKILNKVGQGGMSVVYMAINEKANKTWAVKEVRKDGVLNFESVKQGLVAETNILKKLSHPNLPSIIDVIDTEDSFIIIMDYVQGNSLNKALEEYGAQPQEYVIEWAKQLCDVLGYLHSRQPPIIYRDMKPANIMLKPDGNVTLIDFGTAREFKEKNLADTTCLGTVGYAAPEQFGGMGQTDARTDIYCLGATLYHLVTGCNPSEPPYEMKPIREINPSLSGGLERIILKCTQRNPEDRYQSAAELMYALDHYKEIDEDYKKKQKRKLAKFIVPTALAVVFAVAGFALSHVAAQQATDTYRDILYEASKTADYGEKVALYDAIDGSHPTKTGMERLAKLVLREMLGKEADAILDCRNGQHEYMALEEGTDETRYVCRCCGKLLTVKNWKLLTQKERRPIPDDSEYVMLPPDTTVVLYSDVLPLTIPSTGEKLQIKKPMVTVGRASDSDVRLSARTVARRQAAFFYEQEIWFVRDNFSTNGTWINGRKLIPGKKYQLAAYDEIGFARTEKVIFDLRNESYTPPRQETPPRPMGDFAGEKRIGEYEVIRALAPLSVKDVYLAKSSRTDRLVVLKPCRKDDRPAQKAIRELLLKEADLLRQLDHPAIPKLVEVLEDEETLCVVREYFDGETLESVMAREGTQDLIQVVDWAWQLCDVLRYLHERNYVYRDMKPGNILLRPDGRLALIDFGTMRVYKPGKAGDTVCLGTRGYAAPEQFGGMGQTDARTDIYGLGATLYYLATGCNPGVPPYEIDCIHAMYIDGFPHQLGDLIQKCVQPDPVRRFQSCRELMEALEDASFDVTTNQEKLAQWKRILRREEQS